MRSFLGTLLMLNGALFLTVSLVAWLFLSANLILSWESSGADLTGMLVAMIIALGLLTFIVMGHLMILFGVSMTDPDRPAFPSDRPAAWFVLKTLRQLATTTLIASIFAVVLMLIGPPQRFLTTLAALTLVPILGLAVRWLGGRLDQFEIA